MLVSFKISNFLSFQTEQIFSMVPSLTNENNTHLNKIKNVRLLKMGIILGANSSGKSNLLKALAVGRDLIVGGEISKYKNFFCKLKQENKERETLFEYSFYTGNGFYTYGFTLNLARGKVLTEYLYLHDLETDQEKVVFERASAASRVEDLFMHKLSTSPNLRGKLQKYIKEFSNNSKTLFLTKFYLDGDLIKQFKEFRDVYEYFEKKINLYSKNYEFKIFDLSLIAQAEAVNKLLRFFDTGISKLLFEEIDFKIIRDNFLVQSDLLLEEIERRKPAKQFSFSFRIKDFLYTIVKVEDDIQLYKVLMKHYNADLPFEFFEESDGIKRLFDLFEILLAPQANNVYLFDELNRCIHPLLLVKFIERFNRDLSDFPLQLIFTTHEANILKENIIRKDEIWFVEKGVDNASKLYSLDIFKLTKKNLFDSYLGGNYGAIPVFLKDEENGN